MIHHLFAVYANLRFELKQLSSVIFESLIIDLIYSATGLMSNQNASFRLCTSHRRQLCCPSLVITIFQNFKSWNHEKYLFLFYIILLNKQKKNAISVVSDVDVLISSITALSICYLKYHTPKHHPASFLRLSHHRWWRYTFPELRT